MAGAAVRCLSEPDSGLEETSAEECRAGVRQISGLLPASQRLLTELQYDDSHSVHIDG